MRAVKLRLRIKAKMNWESHEFVVLLPVPAGSDGEERLNALGFTLIEEEGKTLIDNVAFASQAMDLGLEFDQQIIKYAPTDRMRKKSWDSWFVTTACSQRFAMAQKALNCKEGTCAGQFHCALIFLTRKTA